MHSPASFDGIKRETSENLVRTRHCDMGVVLHMPLMILGRRGTAMIRSQDNCLPGILFTPTGYWGYQYVIILSLEFRSYLKSYVRVLRLCFDNSLLPPFLSMQQGLRFYFSFFSHFLQIDLFYYALYFTIVSDKTMDFFCPIWAFFPVWFSIAVFYG